MFQSTFVYKTPLLCNAACKFCLSKAKQIDTSYTYPLKKIVQEFLSIKKRGFKTVILVGGESTIIANLKDYIITARKLDLDLIVTTNGIVFSDFEYLKELNELGLKNLIFSIHSDTAKEHDHVVGVPGSFDLITQAIENANKLNFKHISSSTVINKYNQSKLASIIKFLRKNYDLRINNFCNLEVSYKDVEDYERKRELFPDLDRVQDQIIKIDSDFKGSEGSIGIQNLPLCAFREDTFYLTHEISGKERYYEESFEDENVEMNQRIKGKKCETCSLDKKCKGYFPYFNENHISAFS